MSSGPDDTGGIYHGQDRVDGGTDNGRENRLKTGQERLVVNADGARLDDGWFLVTRSYPHTQHVVLTLWSKDVVWAEVENDGRVIERVLGGAPLIT